MGSDSSQHARRSTEAVEAQSPFTRPRLLDASGAAAMLGLTSSAFARSVEPELARVKVGSAFFYDKDDLFEWIALHKARGSEAAPATSAFMTLNEAARFLRVTVRTLSRWEREGRIRGVKLTPTRQGRKVFRRMEIERFVREAEGA